MEQYISEERRKNDVEPTKAELIQSSVGGGNPLGKKFKSTKLLNEIELLSDMEPAEKGKTKERQRQKAKEKEKDTVCVEKEKEHQLMLCKFYR